MNHMKRVKQEKNEYQDVCAFQLTFIMNVCNQIKHSKSSLKITQMMLILLRLK